MTLEGNWCAKPFTEHRYKVITLHRTRVVLSFVKFIIAQQKKKVAIDIPKSRINNVYQSKIVISFHIPTFIPKSP